MAVIFNLSMRVRCRRTILASEGSGDDRARGPTNRKCKRLQKPRQITTLGKRWKGVVVFACRQWLKQD